MRTAICLALSLAAAPAFADERTGFKVYFEREQAMLTPTARSVVGVWAEQAQSCSLIAVELVGHADTSEPNPDALSSSRAAAVRGALIQSGVFTSKIEVEARSDRELAVKTADDVREPLNRRVEGTIVCYKPHAQSAPQPAASQPAAPAARPKLKPLAELLHPAPVPGEPPHRFFIHFEETGGFSDPGRNEFDAHVGYAKKCNFQKMEVVGHADPGEKNASIVAYSRALQVRSAYAKAGLAEAKIIATGAGASQPSQTQGGAVAAALNRRAEVVITCAPTF